MACAACVAWRARRVWRASRGLRAVARVCHARVYHSCVCLGVHPKNNQTHSQTHGAQDSVAALQAARMDQERETREPPAHATLERTGWVVLHEQEQQEERPEEPAQVMHLAGSCAQGPSRALKPFPHLLSPHFTFSTSYCPHTNQAMGITSRRQARFGVHMVW